MMAVRVVFAHLLNLNAKFHIETACVTHDFSVKGFDGENCKLIHSCEGMAGVDSGNFSSNLTLINS